MAFCYSTLRKLRQIINSTWDWINLLALLGDILNGKHLFLSERKEKKLDADGLRLGSSEADPEMRIPVQ